MSGVCRILVSKRIDMRVKTGILLFLSSMLNANNKLYRILIAIDFNLFLQDFLLEYLQNFGLLSFKHAMQEKFEGEVNVDFIQGRRKLQVDPIMKGFNRERKATVINLDRHGDNTPLEDTINFNKKVVYKDCTWDDRKLRFSYSKVVLSPFIWGKILDYQEDFNYSSGIYTHYFWRLHAIHHLLDILFFMIRNVKGKDSKKAFFKGLTQMPLKIIEMSVLFKDYKNFMVPKLPFLVDSECWDQIKGLTSEFNVREFSRT